ncbi:hypothetical protein, partial [Pseudodesulfovibrio pelocollis]|uniref:hypothetical protein n=1 Tax=Pseudodesulfovibrio pelocollis TaxID=3051432 RepID=UPI00255AAA31
MNRVMLSGLSLLADTGEQSCVPCEFDPEWMITYPSTLIWVDEIIITPNIKNAIMSGYGLQKKHPSVHEYCKMFMDLAIESNIVKMVDPKHSFTSTFFDGVDRIVNSDINAILRNNLGIELDKGAPNGMIIDDLHYCYPRINAFYRSLALAKEWDANILMNRQWEVYLNRLAKTKELNSIEQVKALQHIFSINIPEPRLNLESDCKTCKKESTCRNDNEKTIKTLLSYRDYDEVHEMKRQFQKTKTALLKSESRLDAASLIREFKGSAERLQKQIYGIFPKVRRFSNVITGVGALSV